MDLVQGAEIVTTIIGLRRTSTLPAGNVSYDFCGAVAFRSFSKGRQILLTHCFFVGSLATTFLAGSLGVTAIAQERKSPDLTQTISKVRENVATLHSKLPDFICLEKITERVTENARTIEDKHYLLSLWAARRPHDTANLFSESRDVISATINGKAVNEHRYNPPIHWLRGGFARDLFTFFDEPTSSCYEFKPASDPGAAENNTLVMDVTLNKNPGPLPPECAHISMELSGARVWIDLKALQVRRIQEKTMTTEQFAGPFSRNNGSFASSPIIEYAPVSIHGSEYWLPRSKSVDFIKTKGQFSHSYLSQYSEYQKFETSVTITTVPEAN